MMVLNQCTRRFIPKSVESQVITEDMIRSGILEPIKLNEFGIPLSNNEYPDEEFDLVTSLKLSYKYISVISGLENFRSLTTLRLDNNLIEKIEGINCLTNLQWLDLSFNYISNLEGLNGLAELTDLSLYNNRIAHLYHPNNRTGSGTGPLDDSTRLHILGLGKNSITEREELLYLRRFRNLRCLVLKGNPCVWLANQPVVTDERNGSTSPQKTDEFAVGFVVSILPQIHYLDYNLLDKTKIPITSVGVGPVATFLSEVMDAEEKQEAVRSENIRQASLIPLLFQTCSFVKPLMDIDKIIYPSHFSEERPTLTSLTSSLKLSTPTGGRYRKPTPPAIFRRHSPSPSPSKSRHSPLSGHHGSRFGLSPKKSSTKHSAKTSPVKHGMPKHPHSSLKKQPSPFPAVFYTALDYFKKASKDSVEEIQIYRQALFVEMTPFEEKRQEGVTRLRNEVKEWVGENVIAAQQHIHTFQALYKKVKRCFEAQEKRKDKLTKKNLPVVEGEQLGKDLLDEVTKMYGFLMGDEVALQTKLEDRILEGETEGTEWLVSMRQAQANFAWKVEVGLTRLHQKIEQHTRLLETQFQSSYSQEGPSSPHSGLFEYFSARKREATYISLAAYQEYHKDSIAQCDMSFDSALKSEHEELFKKLRSEEHTRQRGHLSNIQLVRASLEVAVNDEFLPVSDSSDVDSVPGGLVTAATAKLLLQGW
eukprot:Platyproteum_vivax@DN15891_c0_g1_i1.p1